MGGGQCSSDAPPPPFTRPVPAPLHAGGQARVVAIAHAIGLERNWASASTLKQHCLPRPPRPTFGTLVGFPGRRGAISEDMQQQSTQAPSRRLPSGVQPSHQPAHGGGGFCTGNSPQLSQKIEGKIPHLLNLECIGRKWIRG